MDEDEILLMVNRKDILITKEFEKVFVKKLDSIKPLAKKQLNLVRLF
jgi:hypothetical protein